MGYTHSISRSTITSTITLIAVPFIWSVFILMGITGFNIHEGREERDGGSDGAKGWERMESVCVCVCRGGEGVMETKKKEGRVAALGEFWHHHLDRARRLCKRLSLSINCIGFPPLAATVGSGLLPHTRGSARGAHTQVVLVTCNTVCSLLCTCDPGLLCVWIMGAVYVHMVALAYISVSDDRD